MSDARTDEPVSFMIDAAEGVDVHIDDASEGDSFNVKVLKNGAEVESHEGVTIHALAATPSEHFSVELVRPPSAPPPPEDADE